MDMANDLEAARDKLWSMIKSHRFAMLTTRHDDALRSRPMTTIDSPGDESLWFFAAADSSVAEELQRQPQVCLSYSDTSKPDFVSVSGDAVIVSDVAKKRSLWNKSVQAWFPEGAESPHVVLLEVRPQHAEYWDTASNKLVQLFSYARAAATGRPPRDLGEHRDVPLVPRP